MDQYPYSIPPSYPYADNASDKSTNIMDESGVQAPNPYYIHAGSAEFGFVSPPPQQQQQQILPAPPTQANGLMPQMHPEAPAGYNPYENHYPGQVQPPAVVNPVLLESLPPEPAVVCMSEMYSQQEYEREATLTNITTPMDYHRSVTEPDVVPPSLPTLPAVLPLEAVVQAAHSFGPAVQDIVPVQTAPVALACAPEADVEATAQQFAAIASNSSELNPQSQSILASESPSTVSAEVLAVTESFQPTLPTEVDTPQPQGNDAEVTAVSVEGAENELPASEGARVPSDIEPVALDTQNPVEPVLDISSVEPSTSPTPKLDKTGEPTGSSSTKKKRRRIVQFNDDDSDEEDCRERMELLRSPEPPSVEQDSGAGNVSGPLEGDGKPDDNADDLGGGSGKEDDDRPDSRASGSGAASIFHNVVMIPAGESEAHKRKKIRVLESDDEEEAGVVDNVDDIGLTGDGHGDELNPGRFLMDENAEDGDYGAMEGIEMDKMEQIVTMDAPIIDPNDMMNEEEDEPVSESGEKDKDGSDREQDEGGSDRDQDERGSDREQEERGSDREHDERGSDAEQEPEEELGEEEEIVEEGVEMITAENEEGEAIGLATDDENELEEEPPQEESEEDDRGSDQEEQVSEAAQSDAEVSEEEQASESEKDDGDNQNENDQSDYQSTPSPVANQDSNSDQRKDAEGSKSGSEDDVVCQNDLELNTISLLTDEEDDNPTPLPPPKRELPVVRIVNIKKEVLDDRSAKREPHGRIDAAASYQQQHYIRQQQQLALRKQEKKKKKQRVFDNNDPFGAWAESSSDDEFIPNDIYFGTPDRVFTANTKIRCQRQKIMNERFNSKYARPGSRPGKRRYSDDSDMEERRKRKQKMDQVARLNLPSYQQQQLNNLIKKKKKKKPDRFYDKSQDIPNDIYFGNVDVPLHILYAFGSSSSDDERPGRNRPNVSWKTPPSSTHKYSKYQSSTSKPSKSGSSSSHHSRSALSPSNDKSVQAMKEYLKIAGFKNVKFHKLWEGCKSNQERANAILRLMQEKGLEGDPTIAKCRELRKQLQMEREARVLDTSLIIDSGEGRITRRSARNPQNRGLGDPSDPDAPSTSGLSQAPYIPPESLETLNRIKNVIDPDSDGD